MKKEELFDKNELRRLEKAAREKNKDKLYEWGLQFAEQVRQEYEKNYQDELDNSIENFIIAIIYTLHFNEKTRFGNERIDDFMRDLLATIECFKEGSYSPDEYKNILAKEKIHFKE